MVYYIYTYIRTYTYTHLICMLFDFLLFVLPNDTYVVCRPM